MAPMDKIWRVAYNQRVSNYLIGVGPRWNMGGMFDQKLNKKASAKQREISEQAGDELQEGTKI